MWTERFSVPRTGREGFDMAIHHFGKFQICTNESTPGRIWWMAAVYEGALPAHLVEEMAGDSLTCWRVIRGGKADTRGEGRRCAIRAIRRMVRARKGDGECVG